MYIRSTRWQHTKCAIGANIQDALALILPEAQSAMEDVLRGYTIANAAAHISTLQRVGRDRRL
jgi:hypothetical protein